MEDDVCVGYESDVSSISSSQENITNTKSNIFDSPKRSLFPLRKRTISLISNESTESERERGCGSPKLINKYENRTSCAYKTNCGSARCERLKKCYGISSFGRLKYMSQSFKDCYHCITGNSTCSSHENVDNQTNKKVKLSFSSDDSVHPQHQPRVSSQPLDLSKRAENKKCCNGYYRYGYNSDTPCPSVVLHYGHSRESDTQENPATGGNGKSMSAANEIARQILSFACSQRNTSLNKACAHTNNADCCESNCAASSDRNRYSTLGTTVGSSSVQPPIHTPTFNPCTNAAVLRNATVCSKTYCIQRQVSTDSSAESVSNSAKINTNFALPLYRTYSNDLDGAVALINGFPTSKFQRRVSVDSTSGTDSSVYLGNLSQTNTGVILQRSLSADSDCSEAIVLNAVSNNSTCNQRQITVDPSTDSSAYGRHSSVGQNYHEPSTVACDSSSDFYSGRTSSDMCNDVDSTATLNVYGNLHVVNTAAEASSAHETNIPLLRSQPSNTSSKTENSIPDCRVPQSLLTDYISYGKGAMDDLDSIQSPSGNSLNIGSDVNYYSDAVFCKLVPSPINNLISGNKCQSAATRESGDIPSQYPANNRSCDVQTQSAISQITCDVPTPHSFGNMLSLYDKNAPVAYPPPLHHFEDDVFTTENTNDFRNEGLISSDLSNTELYAWLDSLNDIDFPLNENICDIDMDVQSFSDQEIEFPTIVTRESIYEANKIQKLDSISKAYSNFKELPHGNVRQVNKEPYVNERQNKSCMKGRPISPISQITQADTREFYTIDREIFKYSQVPVDTENISGAAKEIERSGSAKEIEKLLEVSKRDIYNKILEKERLVEAIRKRSDHSQYERPARKTSLLSKLLSDNPESPEQNKGKGQNSPRTTQDIRKYSSLMQLAQTLPAWQNDRTGVVWTENQILKETCNYIDKLKNDLGKELFGENMFADEC